MAALILPHRYRSQARGLVEVDYSHPLAAGLVSAYNMTSAPLRTSADTTGRYNGRKSSAGKNPYTLHGFQNDGTTEAGLVYCSEGAVWDFGGTYTTKAYNTKHPVSWSGAVTFVIRVLLRSNTAGQCLIGHFNDGVTPDYLYGCGLYVTGGTLYAVGANNNSRVLSTTAPATDEWVTLACVTNTADGKLAIDGQVVATGTLAGALSSYVFAIGCAGHTAAGATSGAAFLDGLVGPALVFNRALSDAELRSISENPYQILRPANDRLWLDVIDGGGVTGTLSATDVADAASFSGSASAPSVTGTLSATDAQDTASFTGAQTFSGSLSATESPDSAAFAGTAYAPGVSGTLAATDGADSAAFAGALSFVGSLAAVEAQDSASAAGTFGPSGSLAATDQKDSATFAGNYASGVDGQIVAVDQPDSATFAGSAVANVSGSLAAVDQQDRAVLIGSGGDLLHTYGGGKHYRPLSREEVETQWELLELRLRRSKERGRDLEDKAKADHFREAAKKIDLPVSPEVVQFAKAPEQERVSSKPASMQIDMPQLLGAPAAAEHQPVTVPSIAPAIPAQKAKRSAPNVLGADVVAISAANDDEDDEAALLAILEVI